MQNENTEIYVKLNKSLFANIIRIFEGYEYLSVVSTFDKAKGIILLRCTPGTYKDVLKILENLPFEAKILENFSQYDSKKD
jgi:hypothetical protein